MWQRFGRAARGLGQFALAVLIVEKEYTDEERDRKAALAKQPSRKRKNTRKQRDAPAKRHTSGSNPTPTGTIPGSLPLSAPSSLAATVSVQPLGPTTTGEEVEMALEGEEPEETRADDEDEDDADNSGEEAATEVRTGVQGRRTDEERRASYSQGVGPQPASIRAVRKESRTIPEVLDDFVNARSRGIGCRRKVVTLYYSNDKRGAH